MKAYIGLGSNLEDKKRNIDDAIRKIDDLSGTVLRISNYYFSEPWGYKSENNFVNAVILIETEHAPVDLLHILQHIELEMGRTEKSTNKSYSDRIIDLDILLYEDVEMDTPELTLPHPRMYERDFVLIPLKEIQEES